MASQFRRPFPWIPHLWIPVGWMSVRWISVGAGGRSAAPRPAQTPGGHADPWKTCSAAHEPALALDLVQQLPELIGTAVETNPWMGYGAIFAAMLLENLFPPIPSELIMPLGGFYVQQGQLALLPVVVAGLLGTVLGALPWYGIGRMINEERLEQWLSRHGRWIGISPQELHRSRTWFNRYGTALVFWGRLVPGIRTLISVPAGIEMMPFTPFLIWTTAGSLIWTLLLTLAGLAMGKGYETVALWIDPVAKVVKVLLVLAVLGGAVWLGLRTWNRRNSSH